MAKAELTVAVIGAGAITGHHFSAVAAVEGLRACAVADLNKERVEAAAAQYGISAYLDYREMIRRERPDIVAIALPHYLHKEAALFAASHGCHMMLEKPMALSVAECDEIIQAAQLGKSRILVGHTQHYMAENIQAKFMIDSGLIGDLVMIHDIRHTYYFQNSRPDWFLEKMRSGGGILANLGTHSIDKIQWLTGSRVRKVSTSISHYGSRGDVEGSGLLYLELENGMPAAIVQGGYVGAARNETEIIGTKGMLMLKTGDSLWLSTGGPYVRVEVPHSASPFELQYKDLLQAISSGGETGCPPSYGRDIIAILEKVYASAVSGKEQYVERA
ncbi:Gfo/Idh/MocA family protein [Paenibacillus nasutitermitis]|uniref:Glucose-fructose oxidoreductase n=1 Tax=Paenibacillus nasutitermitis TaxID=1652958 RepID=A0A917DZG6_9BACL|nr:Gfo/Idh/MocA family oxidoreductase [Paenibacillus nasutitermitis]GGD83454.1 glucose-fructose oxidoreductase [Paenibacillus nasutitermitis]